MSFSIPSGNGIETAVLTGTSGNPVEIRRFSNADIQKYISDTAKMIPEGEKGFVMIAADSQKKEGRIVFGYKDGHWTIVADAGYDFDHKNPFATGAVTYTFGGEK